jgi:hypothetical protein
MLATQRFFLLVVAVAVALEMVLMVLVEVVEEQEGFYQVQLHTSLLELIR